MTAVLRDRERDRLCDALAAVAPTAPTLCEGWDAHDLAVHVWTLGHDPAAWPGDVITALRPVIRRRHVATRNRWTYAQLVERLRQGDGGLACMPLDALEGHRHALGEYYVHTQDVVRANGIRIAAADAALQAALWKRVVVAARSLKTWNTPGLVLQRPDGTRAPILPGWRGRHLVVTGEPTELMCWVYGRERVADVALDHR